MQKNIVGLSLTTNRLWDVGSKEGLFEDSLSCSDRSCQLSKQEGTPGGWASPTWLRQAQHRAHEQEMYLSRRACAAPAHWS
ncbi:hypothetical protein EPA93_33435 [Ktedonosporobacter rubrisoli]|uniref:Uncharacterized protein n=1 Tax=Ktedonosporobacter rubrisoli TaxID=2509675 RepID=A0A4P6JYJ6_KTERU|nr:hypothetical protein [Ktedonosporobacter rubrisoli]QBD80615.1 hypothetical protein EPA93_33435 [Ktedonosporobacter rubrisoli]